MVRMHIRQKMSRRNCAGLLRRVGCLRLQNLLPQAVFVYHDTGDHQHAAADLPGNPTGVEHIKGAGRQQYISDPCPARVRPDTNHQRKKQIDAAQSEYRLRVNGHQADQHPKGYRDRLAPSASVEEGIGMSQHRSRHDQRKKAAALKPQPHRHMHRDHSLENIAQQTENPHRYPCVLHGVGRPRIVIAAELHDIHFLDQPGQVTAEQNAAAQYSRHNHYDLMPPHTHASFVSSPSGWLSCRFAFQSILFRMINSQMSSAALALIT